MTSGKLQRSAVDFVTDFIEKWYWSRVVCNGAMTIKQPPGNILWEEIERQSHSETVSAVCGPRCAGLEGV